MLSYAKPSPLVLVRFKSQAVLLVAGGAPVDAVATAMGRKPATIEQWLADWRQRRLASIFTGHKNNNNAGKLTREQREEVRRTLQSPLSGYYLPKEFWDVPQLKQYVNAELGVAYESDDSYHFLLKFSNY